MSAPTTAEVREAIGTAGLYQTQAAVGGDPTCPTSKAWESVGLALTTVALPLAEERDAERARADAAEAEVGRRGELLAAERERYVALQRTLDNERHAAMDKSAALMAAEAEVGRMRKLFDDAGQGTYDVLALVEHWQAEAMRMASENDRFREALAAVVARLRERVAEGHNYWTCTGPNPRHRKPRAPGPCTCGHEDDVVALRRLDEEEA